VTCAAGRSADRQAAGVTHLAFELKTDTPEPVLAGVAGQVEAGPLSELVDAAMAAWGR